VSLDVVDECGLVIVCAELCFDEPRDKDGEFPDLNANP
jgi:hypothetical protein